MRSTRLVLVALLAVTFSLQVGCDLTKLTAGTTATMFSRATPAIEQHWDYQLVGDAFPASIIQLEGIHHIVPQNDLLIQQIMQAYVSYTYGWIEDKIEKLELQGEYDKTTAMHYRARLLYQRAKDLGIFWISQNHPEITKKVKADLPEFTAWLKKDFTQKNQVGMLLWTGYAWGSMINQARDDMDLVAELPYAVALVKRSVEIDPTYFNGAGLTFLGVATAEAMGADLKKAKSYFDEAMQVTGGKVLIVQLNYARAYAVKAQNKALFEKLLNEVVKAGDVDPEARLTNMIAKRKAARYLKNEDQFF